MAIEQPRALHADCDVCSSPAALHQFLLTLLDALHLQAKEVERLTSHVEQQTDSMLTPSQIPLVISEISSLQARLSRTEAGER